MEKKLTTKAARKMVEAAYYAGCNGIQIPMMTIPRVFRAGEEAVARGERGEQLTATIRAFVETIRCN